MYFFRQNKPLKKSKRLLLILNQTNSCAELCRAAPSCAELSDFKTCHGIIMLNSTRGQILLKSLFSKKLETLVGTQRTRVFFKQPHEIHCTSCTTQQQNLYVSMYICKWEFYFIKGKKRYPKTFQFRHQEMCGSSSTQSQ